MISDDKWMRVALEQAKIACSLGEVPVGAIIVSDNRLLATGYNQSILNNRATAHAEIVALDNACRQRHNYRLPGCCIYVTLEPCIMCVGAMLQARVARLVFATPEPKTGAVCSRHGLLDDLDKNHRIDWISGVLAFESSQLLRSFFLHKRRRMR